MRNPFFNSCRIDCHGATSTWPSGVALLGALLWLGLAGWGTPSAAWQASSPSPGTARIDSVRIGFNGQVVLGRWVPVAIDISGLPQTESLQVELLARDGDAVPVRYRWTAQPQARGTGTSRIGGLVRLGRASGIEVRISRPASGPSRQPLAVRRYSLDELLETHTLLPGTTRLSLVIGLNEDQMPFRLPVDRGAVGATAIAPAGQWFPEAWIGYESIDRLIVVTADPAAWSLSAEAVAALNAWIRLGGQALFSCGVNSASWFSGAPSLAELGCPEWTGSLRTSRSGPIELAVGSTDQLVRAGGDELQLSSFELERRPDDYQLDDRPFIMRRPWGMGTVAILAFDFTSQPLASWPGTRNLLALALAVDKDSEKDEERGRSGRVTHNGYEDLSGQLRAAIDQFDNVTFVTFTTVALLVALFILLIGPADYLFLRRGVGRMEWTWVTFPLLALIFCGLAIGIALTAKPAERQFNQVEILDIDGASGAVRGSLWTNIYSPRTSTMDIRLGDRNRVTGPIGPRWLSWQGLPGNGLGGMQTRGDFGLYQRDYTCDLDGSGSWITGIPVQYASTRMFAGRWSGSLKQPAGSNLRQSPNTDALLGTVTNPFDVPLVDCVLLYGDWAYLLERPLQPGETIVVEDDMREKTVRGHFTRRQLQGADQVNVPWDQADTNVDRIVAMMMFFEVIGGQRYAILNNDFQRWLDMSRSLDRGQAVLTGRTGEATTPLLVDDTPIGDYDQASTFVRLLYPVQPRTSPRSR